MSKKQQLEGRKFGRLKVIHPAGHKNGRSLWYCECDCGAGVVVRGINLVTGNTESCGCLKSEINARKVKTHGESRGEGTKEYRAWSSMKQRCYNPKYSRFSDYGGRGITVCWRWLDSYSAFLSDVGRCPPDKDSLDRKNVNGNYEPGNVRWATFKEQSDNRRPRKVKQ